MLAMIQALNNYLKSRPTVQGILHNSGWLLADRGIRLGVGFFVALWVARYLGPAHYGTLNYVLAYVGLFSVFSTLGLDSIVVRELVNNPDSKDEILGTTIALRLAGALLGMIAILTSAAFTSDRNTWIMISIQSTILVFQALDSLDYIFQAESNSRATIPVRLFAFLISSGVKCFLILNQASLVWFVGAWVADTIFSSFGIAIVFSKRDNMKRLRISTQWIKTLAKFGLPLAISSVAITFYLRIDQVLIGQMLGNQAVGIYAAAVKLCEMWYFVPVIFVTTSLPSIIDAKRVSADIYNERMQKLYTLLTSIAYAIAILVSFYSTPIVQLLFGSAYEGAGPILSTYVWCSVFVFLGGARNIWITAENALRFSVMSSMVGAVINLVLNYFFIKYFGLLGSAIATLIAMAVASYVINLFFKESRQVFYQQTKALLLIDLTQRVYKFFQSKNLR